MSTRDDRYYVGPQAAGWAVYDVLYFSPRRREGPIHPTREAAQQTCDALNAAERPAPAPQQDALFDDAGGGR